MCTDPVLALVAAAGMLAHVGVDAEMPPMVLHELRLVELHLITECAQEWTLLQTH